MSASAQAPAPLPKRNLRQQAEFIGGLASRCVPFMEKGFAGSTYLFLNADDAAGLEQVMKTLEFFSAHEAKIKRVVKE